MADEPTIRESKNQPIFWLAFAALFSLLFLAVAALTLMSKNSGSAPINNNYVTNQLPAAPSPISAVGPPAPASRPDKGGEAHRMSGQVMGGSDALPGPVIPPMTGRREGASQAVRADTQSPPFYATLSPAAKVQFRVRGLPGGPAGMNGPVPFRVRAWTSGPDGRVAGVQASVPEGEDQAAYSYLPEVAYQPSSAKGPILQIKLSNPRKTSLVNALRAPAGFQFFVAEISATNVGADPIRLDPDMLEIQDSDRVPYLPNPELLSADFPQGPLGSQASARFTAAFLVPADASLVALVAREPGDGLISSPLTPR
jgi:hypothetical protein